MSEIHIGPHTELQREHAAEHPEAFDREINLRAIYWTTGILLVVALITHLVVWFMLEGFQSWDKKRDPAPLPLVAANVQPPPPEPRLQTSPPADMVAMNATEDQVLGTAGADPAQGAQGTMRVPIDVAMEVIAQRGLDPSVVGGQPGGMNPAATPPAQQGTTAPGATVQMSRPAGPAELQAAEVSSSQGHSQAGGPQGSPTPPERR
jgi:hypothetical protein